MDSVSIVVKAKQVGNSIALFVPADICNSLGIKANSDVVAQIQKKKNKDVKKLDSLFGALKGKHVNWSCTEDRLDVWGI